MKLPTFLPASNKFLIRTEQRGDSRSTPCDDERVKAYHPALFEGERLENLEVRAVYLASRVLNAWNSRASIRHNGASSLSHSFDAAKRVAEDWPVPGSHFIVRQLPALVMTGDSSLTVVLADAHTEKPLDGWHPRSYELLRTGIPINLLLHAFASRRVWVDTPPHADTA